MSMETFRFGTLSNGPNQSQLNKMLTFIKHHGVLPKKEAANAHLAQISIMVRRIQMEISISIKTFILCKLTSQGQQDAKIVYLEILCQVKRNTASVKKLIKRNLDHNCQFVHFKDSHVNAQWVRWSLIRHTSSEMTEKSSSTMTSHRLRDQLIDQNHFIVPKRYLARLMPILASVEILLLSSSAILDQIMKLI